VTQATVQLLTNEDRVTDMKEQLAIVRQRLGGPGASGRAADAILDLVRSAERTDDAQGTEHTEDTGHSGR
jgi:hypothetical protein